MRLGPLLALMWSTPALAGGFYFADSGVVENGRGNAAVVGTEGQFAQYYNPAALSRSEAVEVNLGASYAGQWVTFTRVDDAGTTLDPVQNQRPGMEIPQLGVVVPLPADLTAAFGVYSPFATGTAYQAEGPQRYSMIDASLGLLHIGPSLAWQPHPMFSVGAGFQWNILWVERDFDVTAAYIDDEDPQWDVNVRASVLDAFTPSANVGVLFEPHPMVGFGATFQPPATYVASGGATLDFNGHFFLDNSIIEEDTITDEDVSIRLDMPMMLRVGVAVHPIEAFEVEVDFVWENWSSLKSLTVEDIDASIETSIGTQEVPESLELPSGFEDAWSIRLGLEYDVNELLAVRAGGFYEKPALPPQTQSVALLDLEKVQMGAGASVQLLDGRLGIDAFAAYLYMPTLVMTDSDVTNINALEEDEVFGIGNGTYEAFGFKGGLNLRWRFLPKE